MHGQVRTHAKATPNSAPTPESVLADHPQIWKRNLVPTL